MLTSAAGVGASPTIASRAPWPCRPGGLQRRDPVGGQDLVRVQAAAGERSADGKVVGTQPSAGVPVRVGVPPSTTAGRARRDELLPVSCSRMPATVSTLPLIPFGSFGVFTGSATFAPDCRLVDLPLGAEQLLRLADR